VGPRLTTAPQGRGNGGIRPVMPPDAPPHWAVYFAVEDLDTGMEPVRELGGVVHVGPIDIGMARIAVVGDPPGATFMLYDGELGGSAPGRATGIKADARVRQVACRSVRIFSGIQPTGRKHLGNYIGAIEQYVHHQDEGEAIYCIVDLHATTVPYDPAELRERLYDTAAILLAAGLDSERCTFFRQGDVPQHSELTWLLSSVTAFGDLNRMHQFKEKSGNQRDLVSAGLFTYPVLMAADVLAYRADTVPVGDDQRQHVELMRDIAERFNARFGELLVVPEGVYREVGARIMDLQEPARKMSTTGGTEHGTVLVLDDPATIERKFKRAVTDSGSEVRRGADKAGITNLIEILAAVRATTPEAIEAEHADSRYGDFKAAVAETVIEHLRPVRERYDALRADEAALERTLAEGAEKARAIAAPVLSDVRRAMGVGPVGAPSHA
jgi:tryptophanyl-tRNA synthetase